MGQHISGVIVGDVEPEWIVVPGAESFDGARGMHEWAMSTASARSRERQEATEWLAMSLAAIAATTPELELRALYLPSVISELAIVRVLAVDRGNTVADLAAAAGATDPAAVEPPVVEPFETETLGVGVRSVRFLVAAYDRAVTGIVTYAFEVDSTVVRVSYADTDLTRLTELVDAVDRFVRALRLQYGGQAAVVSR